MMMPVVPEGKTKSSWCTAPTAMTLGSGLVAGEGWSPPWRAREFRRSLPRWRIVATAPGIPRPCERRCARFHCWLWYSHTLFVRSRSGPDPDSQFRAPLLSRNCRGKGRSRISCPSISSICRRTLSNLFPGTSTAWESRRARSMCARCRHPGRKSHLASAANWSSRKLRRTPGPHCPGTLHGFAGYSGPILPSLIIVDIGMVYDVHAFSDSASSTASSK